MLSWLQTEVRRGGLGPALKWPDILDNLGGGRLEF
jgi:hypothetical protein